MKIKKVEIKKTVVGVCKYWQGNDLAVKRNA
jgi:hypothetical protein